MDAICHSQLGPHFLSVLQRRKKSVEDKMSRRERCAIYFLCLNKTFAFFAIILCFWALWWIRSRQSWSLFAWIKFSVSNIISFPLLLLGDRKFVVNIFVCFQFRDSTATSFSFASSRPETEKFSADWWCCTTSSGRRFNRRLPTCCRWWETPLSWWRFN